MKKQLLNIRMEASMIEKKLKKESKNTYLLVREICSVHPNKPKNTTCTIWSLFSTGCSVQLFLNQEKP